jgi:glutamyl-tRNA synthetase
VAESRGEPLVKIAQPVRIALTGRAASPPIDEVMDALGKREVTRRLQKAIEYIQKGKME